MTSISFVLRSSSRADSLGSLTLRIIHCRRVKNVTLSGCRLYPHEWSQSAQSVIYPADNPERASFLKNVELRINNERAIATCYISELASRGKYSCDDIISLYRENSHTGKLSGYAEYLAHKLERHSQERTARAYRTVVKGFTAFTGVDIPFERITPALVKSFETHLKDRRLLPNTISYYMRNLRAIYNKAVASGRAADSGEKPFAGVYTGVTRTKKRALPVDELKKLHSLDPAKMLKASKPGSRKHIHAENLYFAWRLFFFCFYARGMCFVDLAYLRKDYISGGVLRYCRKKTGQQVEIKITSELQGIIDSFSGDVRFSTYLFPIIKDAGRNMRLQYENALCLQNRRLKKLSKHAGIRSVSTHVARHTWATVGKHVNVPLQVISECLGHTSEKTTLIYMGMLDNSILDEANDLIISAIISPQSTVA